MADIRQALYERTRTRVEWTLREACRDNPRASAMRLPACPSWSVHDVVAHLTGGCADVIAGNVEGAASDGWTAAQVEARRGWSIDELLAEWADVGPKFAAMLDELPGRYGGQAIADLAVHEQDILGALGRLAARDSLAVALATDFVLDVIVDPGAQALGLPPLEIQAGPRRWIVGSGEPGSGNPKAAYERAVLTPRPDREPRTAPRGHVKAEHFELFRAITGRRSATQIRGFEWTIDPEPYLALFDFWPFAIRESDLLE